MDWPYPTTKFHIPIQFQCTKCQELLFEMKLIMFKVTKGMMIGNHCLQQVKGMMIGNHRLQQVTRVTRVTCMKVIEKFTISALSCINCFACSPQIAGTVNTQRISSSEQWSFDLSSWRKSLSLKYLMDKENTVTAKHSLPLSSWMIVFLLRFYKTGKNIATCSHHDFNEQNKCYHQRAFIDLTSPSTMLAWFRQAEYQV